MKNRNMEISKVRKVKKEDIDAETIYCYAKLSLSEESTLIT